MPVAEPSASNPADFATREDLAGALSALRERSGLTVREVARAAELPVATAGGYFSGRHLPPLATIEQFVRVLSGLGLPDGELAGWVEAVNRLRRAPGPRPATAAPPYRGLAAYQPEDAGMFFGRERLTEALVSRVQAVPTTPLVVVGSSGSGKSSVLRAGLAATLLAHGRRVVVTTPGTDPVEALARTVRDESLTRGAVLIVDQFEELFASGSTSGPTSGSTSGPTSGPTSGVGATSDSGSRFVAGVAALHAAGIVVVLGLRADFFDRALELELVGRWLAENQVVVGPLSAEALRRVVVEPARAAGIEVEDALVEVLVAEVSSGSNVGGGLEAGALPLLSHALYVSWLAASGRRLTLAQYRAVGGLSGAIAQSAEEVHDSLTPEQRAVERETLLRLVYVRDGFADTRRPADRSDFATPPESEVVAAYVEARLLTSDRGQLQLAHEALLTAWPRFRSWRDADRDGLRTHGRLAEAVQHWLDADRDPELLHRGSALEAAGTWALGGGERRTLAAAEAEFLGASQAADARRADVRRRSARRLRLLAACLAVLAVSTGGLAVGAVAQNRAVVHERDLAVSRQLAVTAQSLAGTDPAMAGQVAVAAQRTANTVESRSALLSSSGRSPVTRLGQADGIINVLDVSPDGSTVAVATDAGRLLLWSTGSEPHRVADLEVPDLALYALAFSADGTHLATGGNTGELSVWDATDLERPVRALVDGEGAGTTLYGVAFSPDGRFVAGAAADGTVHLWAPRPDGSFGRVAAVPAFTGTAQAVAVDPTGTVLASAGSDGVVALWDVTDPSRPTALAAPFDAAGGKITSLDFSPDGAILAAGSADSFAHLWDVTTPSAPVVRSTLAGATSWVNNVAFSSDGKLLAGASSDKRLWVWDIGTGAVVTSFTHPSTLIASTWAPDGGALFTGAADGVLREWTYPGPILLGFAGNPGLGAFAGAVLATASSDGLRLWDAADPARPALLSLTRVPGSARLDGSIDVSDALALVVAGDTSGGVHFWNIHDPAQPVFLKSVQAHSDWIDAVSFDASGTKLAVSSEDSSVTLWDLSRGVPDSPTSVLPDLGGFVYTVAFSPDATTLVASVLAGSVRVFDVGDLARPRALGEPLVGPVGYVYSVAFSSDGRTIAASGNDKSVWLWDLTDRTRPTPLGSPLLWADGYATNVGFSPDGGLLAAGMTDGTVRLWDLTDRAAPERWASLAGIAGTVNGVDFSPDGRYVSGAGADRTVRIWTTSLDQAERAVCVSASRGLGISRGEWTRIAGDATRPEICG